MKGTRILMTTILAVTGCTAGVPSVVAPSPTSEPPTPTARIDQSGNVLAPVVDEATWARLAAHPLRPPTLAAGATCAKTPTATISPFTGPLAGPGPVYAAGNTIFYSHLNDGTLGAKVAWIASPDYRGPALVRGSRIDATGDMLFDPGYGPTTAGLHFDYDTGVRAAGFDEGWRFLPSTVLIRAPGCYAFQIDGIDWTATIVMDATANP